jgi:hypothetical protein
MAEVLADYSDTIISADGVAYRAQACGAAMADGLWEGWIEFEPLAGGGTAIRSPRETTQPNRADAVYWASGLSAVYLEGALDRALHPLVLKEAPTPAAPFFDAPAPAVNQAVSRPATAVLNPFSVFEKSEGILERELGALSARHLVNIIVAYRLSDEPLEVLKALPAASLIARIMTAVREQTLIR